MRSRALVVPVLLFQSLLAAQAAPDAVRTGGVAQDGEDFRAVGGDYAARFAPDGVTFTPALGARVDAPAALHCRFEHVRRGATIGFERRGNVAPTATGRQVRYVHSADVTEVYDVRTDGVEQSFVFTRRPEGRGDLVVATRIATELPLAAAHEGGVRYERADAGGVAFGAVIGIDKNGARATGGLRVVGDVLELSLPAAFVDSAAYPLVLDPMIGTTVTLGNGSPGIDRQPSVAFDETTQRYLVVWSCELSATDAEVWAQFVTVTGTPIGNPILVDGNARTGLRPAVASVNDSDRFLLVWGRAAMQGTTAYTQARYASMAASNGALSVSTHFAGNATTAPTGIAVGGNSRQSTVATYDEAIVVATLDGSFGSTAYAWPVQVPVSGMHVAGPLTQLHLTTGPGTFGSPTVTKHAGNGGRWLVTLVRNTGLLEHVEGLFLSSNGTICEHATIATAPGLGQTAVATRDGYEFLVAYDNLLSGAIRTHRCEYIGTCGAGVATIGPALDPVQATGWHFHPELECARNKYVLSFQTGATQTGPRDIRVRGLSLVDGTPAGAIHYAGGSSTPLLAETSSALASRWSGGDTASDEALVVWTGGVIVGRRFEATGSGTVASLGGACGITGLNDFASYNGTPALGTTFTIELLSPTAPVLALIVGFTQAPLACGPCTIVPSADILLASPGLVNVTVPLAPELIGADLFTQWLQLRSSGCPLLPQFGFSNTLQFTIGE